MIPTPIVQYNLSEATVKGLLPEGYTPLAYIESTGTQYIDTGWIPNIDSKIEVSFEPLDTNSTYYPISCIRTSDSKLIFELFIRNKENAAYSINGGEQYNSRNFEGIQNAILTTDKFILNGITIQTGSKPTIGTSYSCYVIGYNNGGSVDSRHMSCKLYAFKGFNLNTLALDYRPARRDSDGVIGMYDLVSKTFKNNSGTGTFIAGPELAIGKGGGKSLPEEYQQVEYLESKDGINCYINTGFVPNNNTRLITSIYPTSNVRGAHFWFGSRSGSSTNKALGIYQGISSGTLYALWNTSGNIALSISGQKQYDIDFNKNVLKINGSTAYTFTSGTFTGEYSIFLFAMNTSGSMDEQKGGMKMHFCKIYDNGTIVRNLYPCYRKSDMKPGMYDVVGSTFYTNQGTGEFTLGPTIHEVYTWEPNAGSGTSSGSLTNISAAYDSVKGWSADFNNPVSYISFPGLNQNEVKSISFWIKTPNLDNQVWYCDNAAQTGLGIYRPDSEPIFIIGSQSRALPRFEITGFTANNWNHIVVIYNDIPKVYINGIESSRKSSNDYWSSDNNRLMLIGARIYNNTSNHVFTGQIQNFMIFDIALTEAQVKELYGQ